MNVKCTELDVAKDNYVDWENKTIVYNTILKIDDGTVREFPVPDELWPLMEHVRDQPLLLVSHLKKRSAYLCSRITKLGVKVFGEKITITKIRKVSESTAAIGVTDPQEIVDNAHRNGHDITRGCCGDTYNRGC